MRHSVNVHLEAEYLLDIPKDIDGQTLLILALHGYGSNPEEMLRLAKIGAGEGRIIASLRAPNQYYLGGRPGPNRDVGYNWGTIPHSALSTALHHEIVRTISTNLCAQFSIPARRLVLMGFSQPVGMNYRFIGTYPTAVGGVIAICGGVPKDWEEDKYSRVETPILHISRSEDEFFPVAVAQGFPERLRKHATHVEFHMLPGEHRFPSKATPIIRAFLEKLKA